MRLFNTLSGTTEPFSADGPVTVYVCGVTPYDTTHAGHAFTYVSFDVLMRYLRFLGYEVIYTQNVTDIDDDILRKSRELGMTWDALGREQTALFQGDMAALNVMAPTYYPRATEETPTMIEIIQALISRGHAYVSNQSVYFAVATDPSFGVISGIPDYATKLQLANQHGNVPDDPNKRDPLDFILWQAAQPGEPTWPSPWGPGRPGWHIECSAMSMRYLGQQIDIHGGGSDLVFPHHAAEIAQSENATGKQPFVRFWMHTGMVGYQGEKMSKSLGNLVLVRNELRTYTPDALRLYLSDHHYRHAWTYDDGGPAVAERLATRLRHAAHGESHAEGTGEPFDCTPDRDRFMAAMDNDLDTAQAISVLADLSGGIGLAHSHHRPTVHARHMLRDLCAVLGLTLQEP